MSTDGEAVLSALREMLSYDDATGHFVWRVTRYSHRGAVRPGDRAGSPDTKGYWSVWANGRRYLAHRLVWLFKTGVWPRGQIDHVDGNRLNNRFENLRLASASQNSANAKRRCDNSSGFKGVCWDRSRGKWMAYITVHGRRKTMGRYHSREAAYSVYCAAAERAFKEYARLA